MSGLFGIALDRHCWDELEQAVPVLQHRGDEWGGVSVLNEEKGKIEAIRPEKGKITPLLIEEGLRIKEKMKEARVVISSVSQKEPQPVTIEETRMGPISLAFDGKIINREELQKKSPYLVGTDIQILVRIIASGKDPLDGLKKVFENIKGPFNLTLLTLDGFFVARDVLGIRPFVLGRFFGDEKIGCAVASESVALEHIGMNKIRDIRPGEIIEVESTGFRTLEQIHSPGLIICGFEYGYWARPPSIIEDIPVGLCRHNAGRKLGPTCPKADIITSLPMSGNIAAEGLAETTRIPYRTVFDFNSEAGGRSFLPFSPAVRTKRARRKLMIIEWTVFGMVVVAVDDSIVEGRQIGARIFLIKKAGAKETHLRIETPMMKRPCPFDITPRGRLMAATHTEEEMAKQIGVKSVRFNNPDSYIEAIISAQSEERREKNPVTAKNICMGCFTGEFPEYK